MAVNFSATRTSTLFNDVDLDGQFDPGDTILTRIRITIDGTDENNNGFGDDAATGVSVTDSLTGVTLVAGSVQVTPIAFDDVRAQIVGNTPVTFTAAELLLNDVDPDGAGGNAGLTITGVSNASGGTIVNNGNGTFTFTPTTGYVGSASFQYTVTDAQGLASVSTGVVSFTVGDPVWYVNAASGSDVTGDGSYAKPFASLNPLTTGGSADSLDNADDTIFLYNTGTYTGSIVLEAGQKLFGDGHDFQVNGLNIGANTDNSDIGGSGAFVVQLGSNNHISGIDVVTTGGSAVGITGSNFGTLTVDTATIDTTGQALSLNSGAVAGAGFTSTSSDAGAQNVALTSVSGTLNLGTGDLAGATGAAISVSGSSVALDYNGNIFSTTVAGSVISVANHSGSVTVDGNISGNNGNGMQFSNADGTYTFNGVINLGGGDAGIDIVANSSGTFFFGTAANLATISHVGADEAFRVANSAANVIFNGDITDPLGNAILISEHDGGTIIFQNGTISANGVNAGGIDITGSNAGSVVFNGLVSLITNANNALTMTNNGGSSISFTGGLDLTTTTGTALTFTGTAATGNNSAGELNMSPADNDITSNGGKLVDISNGTTATGVEFDRIDGNGANAGNAVSINNFDGDADANVEGFVANTIEVANTSGGGDGVNFSGGSSVRLDVNTVTITASSGDGVELNGANGEVDIDTLTVGPAVEQGLEIVGATSLVDIDSGNIGGLTALTDTDADGVLISGGNGNIDLGMAISKASDGNVVEVQNHAGGNVTFSGVITTVLAADSGILLNGNAGTIAFTGTAQNIATGNFHGVVITNNTANIDFTGGNLDINTTGGNAFTAGTTSTATGGTLTISGISNTLASGAGSALVVNGTDIDAGGIKLLSVTKNGGSATGVFLKDTGNAGFFEVTGSGTLNGSGGTFQNITGTNGQSATGIGIYLENVSNVSLSNLDFAGTIENYGIRGFGVNNFTLRDSLVDAAFGTYNGATEEEGAIKFGTNNNGANGLTGTALFEGNTIGANVDTATGTFDTLAIFNNTAGNLNFTMKDNTASGDLAFVGKNSNSGNDGVHVTIRGGATATVLIDGVTFHGSRGDMVQTTVNGTGTLNTTLTNNIMHNAHADITAAGGGITIGGGENPSNYVLNYNITNNSIRGPEGQAIFISTIGSSGTINGVIANNTIGVNDANRPQASTAQATTGSSTGNAIDIRNEKFSGAGNLLHAVRIDNNTITDFVQSGIYIRSNNQGGGTGRVEATIVNNTIEEVGPTTFGGISLIAGGASGSDTGMLGIVLTNNRVNLDNTSGLDGDNNAIVIDQVSASSLIYVPGYVPGANGGRGEAVPPAGGTASSGLSAIWDPPTNPVLVNGEFPNAVNPGDVVDAIQVKNLTGANFVLAVPSFAANPGNNGWEIDDPVKPATPTAGTDTPAPYVDPTPQSGPVADPNPVQTGSGSGSTGSGSGEAPQTGSQGGETAVPANDGIVSQAELSAMVEAAIQRWIDAGATAAQVAAMRAVNVSVIDIAGTVVGSSNAGVIRIDNDGAGYGWFVDMTPGDDSEFAGSGSKLAAIPGGAAAGKLDLLTVLVHEFGHHIGLDDVYATSESDEVMFGYANVGERRMPDQGEADGAVPGSVSGTAFALTPVAIGTIPPGKTVDIFFKLTIDTPPPGKIVNPQSTSTVSWDHDNNVNTAPIEATTATETLILDSLTLGNTVYIDADKDGMFDAGEGVNGVSVSLFLDNGTVVGELDASDTQVGTSVLTAGGGLYSFNGLAPGEYIVRIDSTNFAGALAGRSTAAGSADADADITDGDDNGIAAIGGSVASKAITLAYNTEPTDGNGNDTNNTLDFGFVTLNQAPTSSNMNGDTATYLEGAAPVRLDTGGNATLSDSTSADFAGGTLTVAIGAGAVAAEDVLSIATTAAVTLGAGSTVVVNGTSIGTYSGGTGGTPLVIAFNSGATAARVQEVLRALQYNDTNLQNPGTVARAVSITLVDGDGNDGGLGSDTLVINTTVNVTDINDAPSGPTTASAGVAEAAVLTLTASHFSTGMTDPENHGLGGVRITTLPTTGTLKLNGVAINSVNTDVTLLQLNNNQLTYEPAAGSDGTSPTFTFQVRDNGGTGNGGIDLDPNADTFTINVGAPGNTAPVAKPDAISTPENVIGTGSLFADNGSGPDSDAENDQLTISSVSGGSLGVPFQLASGAMLTVNSDGTYSYDPNGKFNSLTDNSSGAVNTSTVGDTFQYTLAGGNTVTVTVTVTGVAGPGDKLLGDGTDNTITGTPQSDFFDLRQGGNDTAHGLASNDVFYMGGAMTSGDTIHGGEGVTDVISLQGNYAALTFGNVTGIEVVTLLSGNNTVFGDTGNNSYSYNITVTEGNVAAGGNLKVNGATLRQGENFTFNGSQETNGTFYLMGGNGVDNLTGGQLGDVFFFAESGRFGANDKIDGQGGYDNLVLRGTYTINLNAVGFEGVWTNIESLTLASGGDTRFGSPLASEADYSIVWDNDLLATGATFTVNGAFLGVNETMDFNGSSETGGHFRLVGGQADDVLRGGGGDDLIYGNMGADTMSGGDGADVFRYDNIGESNSAGQDGIQDFSSFDLFDLSRIDANVNLDGNQAFTFIGAANFTGAGQLRAVESAPGSGLWTIYGDVDGGGADFQFAVVTTGGHIIGADDFLL